jgi:hypothetical protein
MTASKHAGTLRQTAFMSTLLLQECSWGARMVGARPLKTPTRRGPHVGMDFLRTYAWLSLNAPSDSSDMESSWYYSYRCIVATPSYVPISGEGSDQYIDVSLKPGKPEAMPVRFQDKQ